MTGNAKICTHLVLAALAGLLSASSALASGGVVKLKTDNRPNSYYYNALGRTASRYCSFYRAGEFLPDAVICGVRVRAYDQSVITDRDTYVLGLDLRLEDPGAASYADLTAQGLVAMGDPNSVSTCSEFRGFRTRTFGGGAGVAAPVAGFLLTMPQPANNDQAEGIDFCGVSLDTDSLFANSARSQSYSPGGVRTSIGFNHFVEAVVFEPRDLDLRLALTGSSRFPGDRGLPAMFARRRCSGPDCRVDRTDGGANNATDDFLTARLSIDNQGLRPRLVRLAIEAHRAVIDPRLEPRDVTGLFRSVDGGEPVISPIMVQPGRTVLNLEIRTAIRRRLLSLLPLDLRFTARLLDLEEPNDPNEIVIPLIDRELERIGIRAGSGYYDGDRHGNGFLFPRSPVQTGDAFAVRFDAIDLPRPGNTLLVTGAEVVGGEFGASGLPGLDAFQLRREDAVLAGNPDLSPQGLFRAVGTVGDPGNGDGIPFGPPATTVALDFTNYVTVPSSPGLALNLFALAFLNPGDTGSAVTAIGSSGGEVFIGNSSTLLGGALSVSPLVNDDMEIRLDLDGELGTTAGGRRTKRLESAALSRVGELIAVEKGGRRVE